MFNILTRTPDVRDVRVSKPPTRTRMVGLRLREPDARALEALAEEQGTGISTFARLIIEAYLKTNAPKGRK